MRQLTICVSIALFGFGILLGGMSVSVQSQQNPEILIIEPDEPLIYAAWNSDETLIQTRSGDSNLIQIWDAETGELVLKIPEDKSFIGRGLDSAFTQMFSSTSEVVVIRDIWTDEVILELRNNREYGFINVVSNSDGTRIRTLNENYEIAIWDGVTGEQLFTVYDGKYGEQELGIRVSWSPDGSQIRVMSAAGGSNWVDMWDAESGELLYTIEHDMFLSGARWNATDSMIITTSYNEMVWIWDSQSGELIYELPQPNNTFLEPSDVLWNADESLILVVIESVDGCINGGFCGLRIWDVKTGTELMEIGAPPIEPIDSRIAEAAWSPDGTKILVRTWNSWLYVWDLSTGEPEFYRNVSFPMGGVRVHKAVWDADGSHILVHGYSGSVLVWEVESDVIVYRNDVNDDRSGIQDVRWNHDGTRLLIWGDDVRVVEISE